jgi:hypothetical protein
MRVWPSVPTPQAEHLAALRSRRHHDLGRAFEGEHLCLDPQHGLDHGHRQLDVQVVALSGERRVLAHARDDHQVAARSAERAGMSLAGHTQLGAGVHAGRDGDGYCSGLWARAAATALGAGITDPLTGSVAGRTGLRGDRAPVRPDDARAAAVIAAHGICPRAAARRLAGAAG